MVQTIAKNEAVRERKIISVSTKRQLTIPQKYYEFLGFDNEAECVLHEDGILIRPLQNHNNSDFSEQILTDLISRGYEGKELLSEFKKYTKSIRSAVLTLINEADELAKNEKGCTLDELFNLKE